MQYYLRLELPQAGGTLRLAVCQYYTPQAGPGPTHQDLYVIKLNDHCTGWEAADIDSIDCLLCHVCSQDYVMRKRKKQHQPDAADAGKLFLWRYYNLSRMA